MVTQRVRLTLYFLVVKTRGSYLRVHFKNTRETVRAIQGMTLPRAVKYLENVKAKQEIVPFKRFRNGGIGRKAMVCCYCVILCHCKCLHICPIGVKQ